MEAIIRFVLAYWRPGPKQTEVKLPDMFQSFLKSRAPVNSNYQDVKGESEQWLSSFCSLNAAMQRTISKCDFSFFVAIAAPQAPRAEFRTLCDWGNWVFPYDDMFDNGHLRDQPEESERIMQSLMVPMLVERLFANTTTGLQKRFAQAMQSYCDGALMQVGTQSLNRSPSLEEVVATRRESSGCKPLYHLVEYAHGLVVPDDVFDDPAIQELEILGVDMVAISNDILSYRKELAEGVPHNMVAVCRLNGMSAQQAFDTVGDLLMERYQRWDEVEASVPSWGDAVDAQVRQYIEGIKSVVKANLHWSFKSERYLGPDPGKVRETRILQLPAKG